VSKHRGIQARGVEDINTRHQRNLAVRLQHAMRHPDCPTFMLDMEASQLARFLAVHIYTHKGPRAFVGAYEKWSPSTSG